MLWQHPLAICQKILHVIGQYPSLIDQDIYFSITYIMIPLLIFFTDRRDHLDYSTEVIYGNY